MKILIADDDPTVRFMLEDFLTEWGYEVVSASDGNEAWKILQQDNSPNLVLLDWMMPHINGIELCSKIREKENADYTYIILLTSKTEKEDIVTGLKSGADDFVSKPFDSSELKSRIMAGIRVLEYESKILSMTEKRIALERDLLRAQKLESIGILSRGLAHDFNNLLTVINVNISLMKKFLNPEKEVYEDLIRIENASNGAKDLVRRFISFARGKAPSKKTTSIGKLIKDSVNQANKNPNIHYDFSIPDNIQPIEVDSEQISQVINDMLFNARDAMLPHGGKICVGLENFKVNANDSLPIKEGEYVRISVRDHGKGISHEDLGKVFDPYFSTKDMGVQKGMGFGLAVCYTLIKNHDGLIRVESKPGNGTTFYIYLPA